MAGRVDRPRWRRSCALLLALLGCGGDPTAAVPACGTPPVLEPDHPVVGTLTAADPRRAGSHIRHYTVQLHAVGRIDVTMSSVEIEPFLFLFDSNGRVIAQGYDRRPGAVPSVAELSYPAATGCYLVGASTWRPGTRGSYVLSLEVEPL